MAECEGTRRILAGRCEVRFDAAGALSCGSTRSTQLLRSFPVGVVVVQLYTGSLVQPLNNSYDNFLSQRGCS